MGGIGLSSQAFPSKQKINSPGTDEKCKEKED